MARNHKRAKKVRFTKSELALIAKTNEYINPEGIVTALGPNAIGVLGDARSVGVAVIVRYDTIDEAMMDSNTITNRVKGITRVLMEIPITRDPRL